MATTYVLIDIEVTDLAAFQEYQRQSGLILEHWGGKFIARAGQCEVLEGDWQPNRLSIIEFESVEKALNFYRSPEYQAVLPIRQRSANTRILVLQGL